MLTSRDAFCRSQDARGTYFNAKLIADVFVLKGADEFRLVTKHAAD